MEMLISGILSYSRISKNTIKPDVIKVKSFLNELITTIEVPESFTITIPNKLPAVIYPKVRLEQVFINLITNAIKYHDKAHGTIEIGYKLTGNKHEFSVTDDGPGIDPEYHEKIFMIFQTLQSKDVYESTGIGLTIVKKIIEDQGGNIWVESEVGTGASFVFTIPANPNSD
jgi:signal transduction histidine kinase